MQRSIIRFTTLLDALSRGDRGLSAGEIAAATQLPAATCSRLLKGLARSGWVDQDINRGAYRLGPRIHALAEARPYQAALLAAARPVLRELVVRHPGSGAVIIGLRPWRRFRLWGCSASRTATAGMDLDPEEVWSGASGRLLVSLLTARERGRWIDQAGLPRPQDWPGITSRAELLSALAEIRHEGFSLVRQPRYAAYAGAVAVRDDAGGHIALGCYHPGQRPQDWLLGELRAAAAAVTAAVHAGGRPSRAPETV